MFNNLFIKGSEISISKLLIRIKNLNIIINKKLTGNDFDTGQQNHKATLGTHMRNSSLDYRLQQRGLPHSRTPSLDLRHARNNSADLNKLYRNDIGLVFGPQQGNVGLQ